MPIENVAFCGLCSHCDVDLQVCILSGLPVDISGSPCGDYQFWAECVDSGAYCFNEIYEG